ncbi:MAG: hypothetical protein NTZ44_02710 [Candidatus Nomurabacteria bacterium]|nr:hypothetical protein [Candidatus Nomurabacteria bacterium]
MRMTIENEEIDNILSEVYTEHKEQHADRYIDHYLEQYRIYLHIFNGLSERRQKANEFFLGLNTAIMAIMGYIETKEVVHISAIFILVPFVGIAICYCWYQMILSFRQLNRAKFKVIHSMEKKLPASLFGAEWKLLGEGKDDTKYIPLSRLEKRIPIIFIILYLILFFINSPIASFFHF